MVLFRDAWGKFVEEDQREVGSSTYICVFVCVGEQAAWGCIAGIREDGIMGIQKMKG